MLLVCPLFKHFEFTDAACVSTVLALYLNMLILLMLLVCPLL
jgi:hypothetical protein